MIRDEARNLGAHLNDIIYLLAAANVKMATKQANKIVNSIAKILNIYELKHAGCRK